MELISSVASLQGHTKKFGYISLRLEIAEGWFQVALRNLFNKKKNHYAMHSKL